MQPPAVPQNTPPPFVTSYLKANMATLTSKGVSVCDVCLYIATCDMHAENKCDFQFFTLYPQLAFRPPPCLLHASRPPASKGCRHVVEYEIFTFLL